MSEQVAQRFARAAARYPSAARVQQRIAARFAGWLAQRGIGDARSIAEVGAGTGFLTAELLALRPQAAYHITDIAPAMVEQCRRRFGDAPNLRYAVADARQLQLDTPSQWLVSSMCLQWVTPLEPALRYLKSQCEHLAVSIMLDGSFDAWREAHARAGLAPGLRELPRLDLLRRQFPGAEIERLSFTESHADGLAFARALREIGADQPRADHRAAPLRRVLRHCPAPFTANYEVAFLRLG